MKKINFRNGNGEMLGFAVCIPILVIMIIGVLAISTFSIRSQQLTVSTYAAGRSAAVSQTKEIGMNRAKAVLENTYMQTLSESTEPGSVWMYLTSEKDDWNTGDLFTIEVHQVFPKLTPFEQQDQVCRLTMMIEGGV